MRVEHLGQSGGHCNCCGNESRCVWGMVHESNRPVAAYWMNWTVAHLADAGANLDLVIGRWGDDASADDRIAVSLLHREIAGDRPALMIIDAAERPFARTSLASAALARADVIGKPLAQTVFGLIDVIYKQDGRFF